MRIISGQFKSRSLIAPQSGAVRPTSDKVRQAIFNVLEHADWAPPLEESLVLDAFCGTGALGIEALSRGAAKTYFMDKDLNAVQKNIDQFKLHHRAQPLRCDILKPPPASQACDFIFLDPPYHKNLIDDAIQALQKHGWLHNSSVIIAESEKGWNSALLQPLTEKIYGSIKASFYVLNA